MRHLLALFPVDRADLDRHAATIAAHFADPDDRITALVIVTCVLALVFTGVGVVVAVRAAL